MKRDALEKRAQERQAKLEQLRKGITATKADSPAVPSVLCSDLEFSDDINLRPLHSRLQATVRIAEPASPQKSAEDKKKDLFEQRAREREARLAQLRNFGQQKKEEAIKEKEELEKEAQERKQRLVALKAASVKRFNEKQAVLQAIKMKEEEIRKKQEEEEAKLKQREEQKQAEKEKEEARQAEAAAAAEAKARKEQEEREKKAKELQVQQSPVQPAKSPRAVE